MSRQPVEATAASAGALLDAVDQPMFALDIDGLFIFANQAFAASRGLAPDRVIGRPFATGLADVGAADRLLRRVRDGETTVGELELGGADIGARVVERLGPWRNPDGGLSGFWGVGLASESAELRREAEVLRNVDEARRNLLSTVSHELRTPLAAIQGYASTFLLYEERLEAEERREFLQRIVNSTLQLEELIDNLLTASRIEHGTLQIAPRAVQLSKLVLEAIAEAQMRTERQELTFAGPERCELTLDPRRIRQVIHNLLDNAIKYGGEGLIDIVVEDRGDDVVLSVSDHGGGISVESLPHLFERFYRAGTTTSAKGTGLGLWISKAIVEAHEGQVDVHSDPGQGTTFTIVLPRGLAVPEA
ncbi:MAG: PAS domain-containing protein [Dehalococcoidia bacterium]|nr:PAS domain-containing protein [Dehalococcoidia bacterium]